MESSQSSLADSFTLSNKDMGGESHFYPRPVNEGMLASTVNFIKNPGSKKIRLKISGTPNVGISIVHSGEHRESTIYTDTRGEYNDMVDLFGPYDIRFQLLLTNEDMENENIKESEVSYEFVS